MKAPFSGSHPDSAGDNRPAPWIAWIWIAGGIYMLARAIRTPGLAVPHAAALFSAVIVLGISQLLIEYVEAFKAWRILVRYVMLAFALVALVLVFWWDFSRFW